jgi:hypothetical protein
MQFTGTKGACSGKMQAGIKGRTAYDEKLVHCH